MCLEISRRFSIRSRISLRFADSDILLHWTQNFSAPSVLAFISAPEKTFVKQDANEILSAEGEQFN